jgi:hypothetical protein
MLSSLIIIILGIIIATVWQFAFSSIYTFIFELYDIPLVSSTFLSIFLLAQSFFMGIAPCMLIVYFSKLSAIKSAYLLLSVIVISCVLMEIWVGGLIALIGLALARSAWIFLFGALTGCYFASLIKNKK